MPKHNQDGLWINGGKKNSQPGLHELEQALTAYYNEIDPFAAAWLRELIKAKQIADGVVDERDIRDIEPRELSGFTQCHFFAGIGVWSYALRLAGWPDDKPVWTGSAPCQPFSAAGKQQGVTDERHLWPAFFHLISACKPDVVFGEQVEAAIRHGWLDLIQDDLEGINYETGAVGFPAASVGAPHIRQRLYFAATRLAHTNHSGLERRLGVSERSAECAVSPCSVAGRVAQPDIHERRQVGSESGRSDQGSGEEGLEQRSLHGGTVNGFWSSADWIYCRDNKYRPVEPGTFPLAHGAANRVGRLRGYGNAIVAPQAAEFVKAFLGATQ